MNDPQLAATLRSRSPDALPELLHAYGDRLFGYCWRLLRNRENAQIAVRDALVVAIAQIERLDCDEWLGLWVYSLARAECLRREAVPPGDADEPPARPHADDADSRLMAWKAVTSMPADEVEALELDSRHHVDLRLVLGLSAAEAEALLDRARRDLERALGAEILIGKSHACPDRAEVITAGTGTTTPAVRDRVLEHAATCSVCGPSLPRSVSPARVFALLPSPALSSVARLEILEFFGDSRMTAYREFAVSRAAEALGSWFLTTPEPAEPDPQSQSWFAPAPKPRPAPATPAPEPAPLPAAETPEPVPAFDAEPPEPVPVFHAETPEPVPAFDAEALVPAPRPEPDASRAPAPDVALAPAAPRHADVAHGFMGSWLTAPTEPMAAVPTAPPPPAAPPVPTRPEPFIAPALAPVISLTAPAAAPVTAPPPAQKAPARPEPATAAPAKPSPARRRMPMTRIGVAAATSVAVTAVFALVGFHVTPSSHISSPPPAASSDAGSAAPQPGGGADAALPVQVTRSAGASPKAKPLQQSAATRTESLAVAASQPGTSPSSPRQPGQPGRPDRSASSSASAARPAATGSLTVDPDQLDLGTGTSGQLTLTATGGPVSWSASTSSGQITLSSQQGTLQAGQSVTLWVSLSAEGSAGSAFVFLDAAPVNGAAVAVPAATPATSQAVEVTWTTSYPRGPRPGPSESSSPSPSQSPSPSTSASSPAGVPSSSA